MDSTNARERGTWSGAVAATIRAERAARGWTQDQLAEKSGVSRPTIARFELGERVPDVMQLYRLAAAFGLHTSALIEAAERRA